MFVIINAIFFYLVIIMFIISLFLLGYSMYKIMKMHNYYLKRRTVLEIINYVSMSVSLECRNLSWQDKVSLVLENVNLILEEKKIKVLELELNMLVESSLRSINLMKGGI